MFTIQYIQKKNNALVNKLVYNLFLFNCLRVVVEMVVDLFNN